MNDYAGYDNVRQAIQQATGQLNELLADGTFQRVHGNTAQQLFAPLETLLNNMDKPAA